MMNIDRAILSVPISGWIAISLFILCILLAVLCFVLQKNAKRQYNRMWDISDNMRKMNQSFEQINDNVRTLSVSIDELSIQLDGYSKAVQKSVDYNFTLAKNYNDTDFTERRKPNDNRSGKNHRNDH